MFVSACLQTEIEREINLKSSAANSEGAANGEEQLYCRVLNGKGWGETERGRRREVS